MRFRNLLFFIGLNVAAVNAYTQPSHTLVVRLDQDRVTQQVVPEGLAFTVEVRNQMPAGDYQRTLDVTEREVPAIDLSVIKPAEEKKKPPLGAAPGEPTCTGDAKALLDALGKQLTDAKDEKAVATAVGKLEAISAPCSAEAAELIAKTRYTFTEVVTLRKGQQLVVTVKRGDTEWRSTYVTGGQGSFRTSYGLTYLPNRDREYFSFELGPSDNVQNDQKYEIRRKRRNDIKSDFVPTIDFSWFPAYQPHPSWSIGPTFGFGFDFSSPVALVGLSATYHQNFAIALGAAAQKQKRLVGIYHEGQRIKENLDSSALSRDTYAPNAFISVTIRSLSNPFSK